jgi:type I restriction enzyme S subunit
LPFVSSDEIPRNIYWLYFATKDQVKLNAYKGHWPEFMAKQIIIPPPELADLFGSHAAKNLHMIYLLEQQNQKGKQARDLLLPRLMSGEIPV